MASMNFELKDADGIDTEIGDEITVTLPELYFENGGNYEYFRPEMLVRARVLCPPSSGLRLKILEVLKIWDDPEEDEIENLIREHVGKNMTFPRTKLVWRKTPARPTT